ncbi:MAG: cytochrome c3 family protein [Planctomycetota bacterium]
MSCATCHVPDSAPPGGSAGLAGVRWNRIETARTFEMYVPLSGVRGVLDGPSQLCLGCHDGVSAADQHGGAERGRPTPRIDGIIGPDLADDHPVGILYPPRDQRGLPRKGYFARPRGDVQIVLVDGRPRVECTSCHDPHGSPYDSMLRESLQGSALCFGCHDL